MIFLKRRESLRGVLVSLKASRAEEHDGVLNLLAPEARQRFLIFGHDAEDAAIRAVEERWIFVRHGCGFEVVSHSEIRKLEILLQSAGHQDTGTAGFGG